MFDVLVPLAVLSSLVVPVLLVVLVVAVIRSSARSGAGSTSQRTEPAAPSISAPPAVPLPEETVAEVSRLVHQGKKIPAIKALRVATGMGLKEAKDRVDGWSDVIELRAAQGAALPDGDRLRIEAAAVVSASGWHVADAFLREQRGLTPEASRALLDSVT